MLPSFASAQTAAAPKDPVRQAKQVACQNEAKAKKIQGTGQSVHERMQIKAVIIEISALVMRAASGARFSATGADPRP